MTVSAFMARAGEDMEEMAESAVVLIRRRQSGLALKNSLPSYTLIVAQTALMELTDTVRYRDPTDIMFNPRELTLYEEGFCGPVRFRNSSCGVQWTCRGLPEWPTKVEPCGPVVVGLPGSPAVYNYVKRFTGGEGFTVHTPLVNKQIMILFREEGRPLTRVYSNPQAGEYMYVPSTGDFVFGVETQINETMQLLYKDSLGIIPDPDPVDDNTGGDDGGGDGTEVLPLDIDVAPTTTTATVSWVQLEGITSYKIEIRLKSTTELIDTAYGEGPYVQEGLTPATEYTALVYPVDDMLNILPGQSPLTDFTTLSEGVEGEGLFSGEFTPGFE